MAGSKPASAPQRASAWAAAFASVAIRTAAPGKASRSSRPSGSSPQPSIAGASSTRSSNGIPKVDTPTAASSRPGAAAARRSRAACMPRSKLARAPLSPPLETVADASCSPSNAHTAMAILVPPKSRPSTTGGSATEDLSRGRQRPPCPILLGQYPNYQAATRPLGNSARNGGYVRGQSGRQPASPGWPGAGCHLRRRVHLALVIPSAPARTGRMSGRGRMPGPGWMVGAGRTPGTGGRRCWRAGRQPGASRVHGPLCIRQDLMREVAVTVTPAGMSGAMSAARPQLIRALNEQLLLGYIRDHGPCSRADLARLSGLSKPTVSLALATVEQAGLVQEAGQRIGRPGRSALLYEIKPEAGFVLGLDVGAQYIRGALADLAGEVRVRSSARSHASGGRSRAEELASLGGELCAKAGLALSDVTQTVIGSPGIYDARRNAMALTGGLPGWDRPAVLARLREVFGQALVVENDVDAAALAERAHGHGREVDSFAFVSVGTGIGMGLVIGGQLFRGAHGVAGEIAYMPMTGGHGTDPVDARKRGALEASASAPAVVRAARRAGMRGQVSARRVFTAAAHGDERAAAVVAEEAVLVARVLCAVVTVVDPELIVLGGGVGQAPGFAAAVTAELRSIAPVMPEVRVSALGTDAVVDGCLASGAELAWAQLTGGPAGSPAAAVARADGPGVDGGTDPSGPRPDGPGAGVTWDMAASDPGAQ